MFDFKFFLGSTITFIALSSIAAYFPTIPWTSVTSKPTFATVATSGLYTDLSSKPAAVALTTTGSGAATWNGGTGALNIPTPSSGASSVGMSSTDMDVTGSPVTSTGTIIANLKNSGCVPGTYNSYTCNAKGLITNCTTATSLTKCVNKASTISTIGAIFVDTVSITVSNPTVSLSSYITLHGYTSCVILGIIGYRSGGSYTTTPQVGITAMTSTSVSCAVTQQNTAVVTILGINVLSGNPLIAVPDPTNVKLLVSAYYY